MSRHHFRKVFWNARYLLPPEELVPYQRWIILFSYWLFLFTFVVYPFGYLDNIIALYNTSFSTTSSRVGANTSGRSVYIHIATFIYFHPIMLALWNETYINSFGRKFSWFSAIFYPLGQTLDTMMWCASFDLGCNSVVYLGSHNIFNVQQQALQFLFGTVTMITFIAIHRITIEQWYIPLHHYPPNEDPNVKLKTVPFIIVACVGSIIFALDWYMTRDILFLIVIRYAFDLHICLRIRFPDPWQDDNMASKQTFQWLETNNYNRRINITDTTSTGRTKAD